MSKENVEVVRGAYEAFGSGDMETVGRLLSSVEWHEMAGMPYGGTWTGTEEIFTNVLGPISQDVQDFSARPDQLLDTDTDTDQVVSLGRYRGRGAAGEVDVPFAHVWTVRDGSIVRFEQYADTKLFVDALGR